MTRFAFLTTEELSPVTKWLYKEFAKVCDVDLIHDETQLSGKYDRALLRLWNSNGDVIGSAFDVHPAARAAQRLIRDGTPVLNGPIAQEIMENKLLSGNLLAFNGLPVLPAFDNLQGVAEYADGWIIKPNRGELGLDIHYAKTIEEANKIGQGIKQPIYQHFLPNARCIRVVASFDRVFDSYEKQMENNDNIVASISLGGKRVAFDHGQADVGKLSMQACAAVSGTCVGVDILIDENDKAYVLEINSNPGGLASLERSVQDKIIQHLVFDD